MSETQNFDHMSTRHRRIAELAERDPHVVFTSLNHLLDLRLLHEAFLRTRKDGAPGVDGQTWQDYEAQLEDNLQSLLDRAKSGTYRASPVRRAHIPKAGSSTETRPIGIPTIEDKVLQRAVLMILELIYERDFFDCSYGFRKGRSAHQALESLWKQAMGREVKWILDVDIRKFFDTLVHPHLRELLQLRVNDGVLLRLIGKWLKAGVLEEDRVTYPEEGTPQGGVISPLLANVYLHHVLDQWFYEVVRPRLRGKAFLIRFADDFVIGFTDESDARRVLEVLPKRFAKYGLSIHPEKTRLVPFQSPGNRPGSASSLRPEPDTFDFLGFTHHWAKSRKGNWVVKRRTASSRFTRAVRAVSQWCKFHRHDPIRQQHEKLCQKLRGHCAYYGITGNSHRLSSFHREVSRAWYKWLCRRRRKNRPSWAWFNRLLQRYPLPPARAIHSVYVAKS